MEQCQNVDKIYYYLFLKIIVRKCCKLGLWYKALGINNLQVYMYYYSGIDLIKLQLCNLTVKYVFSAQDRTYGPPPSLFYMFWPLAKCNWMALPYWEPLFKSKSCPRISSKHILIISYLRRFITASWMFWDESIFCSQ